MAGKTDGNVDPEDRERIDSMVSAEIRAKDKFETWDEFYAKANNISRTTYQNMVKGKGRTSSRTMYGILRALELPAEDELVRKYLPEDVATWNDKIGVEAPSKPDGNRSFGRRTIFGTVASLAAVLAATLFFIWPQSPQEEALSYLRDRGITLQHDDIRAALKTADIQTLEAMQMAGVPANTLELLLSDEAKDFFAESQGDSLAIEWVMSLVESGLFSDFTTHPLEGRPVALLFHAMNAKNVDLAIALLEAGASPHPFSSFSGSYPAFLFPIRYASKLDISNEERDRLINALFEHGTIFVRPIWEEDNLNFHFRGWFKQEAMDRVIAGIDGPIPASISAQRTDQLIKLGQPRSGRLCEAASRTDSRDWCQFIKSLPGAIEHDHTTAGGHRTYDHSFQLAVPIDVMAIVGDKVYLLAYLQRGFAQVFGVFEATYGSEKYSVYWEGEHVDIVTLEGTRGENSNSHGVMIIPNDPEFEAPIREFP